MLSVFSVTTRHCKQENEATGAAGLLGADPQAVPNVTCGAWGFSALSLSVLMGAHAIVCLAG